MQRQELKIQFRSLNPKIIQLFKKIIKEEFITNNSDLISKSIYEYAKKNYPKLVEALENESKTIEKVKTT